MTNRTEKQCNAEPANVAFGFVKEFFYRIDMKSIENVLRDNLKADMGNDNSSGKHSAFETNHQVGNTVTILQFLRTFPAQLSTINVNENEALKEIQNRFHQFDYEKADIIICDGLKAWIYQDEDQENACIEYAFRISKVYNEARELLEMCWDFCELQKNTIVQKGGAKC